MKYKLSFVFDRMNSLFLLLVLCGLFIVIAQKKHGQEIRRKSSSTDKKKSNNPNIVEPPSIDVGIDKFMDNIEISRIDSSLKINTNEIGAKPKELEECPPCPVTLNQIQYAIQYFWNDKFQLAYACACNSLTKNPNDNIGKALIQSLKTSKKSTLSISKSYSSPTTDQKSSLRQWEILGPFNIGKLELDADQIFPYFHLTNKDDLEDFDAISHILALNDSLGLTSDLTPEGKVSWKKITSQTSGQVDVHYAIGWNELGQGFSSNSVFEYQAWIKTTTYVKSSGSYILDCQGPHTIYVRNDDLTRVLIADVYRAHQVIASLDLKAGLVGIVFPLRVVLQSSFMCTLTPSPGSIQVFPAKALPHLVETPLKPGKGLLFSNVFSLPVHNPLSQTISLEFSIKKPVGEEETFFLKPAQTLTETKLRITPVTIAPGQTYNIPLEITTNMKDRAFKSVYLNCRDKRVFTVVITPSRGVPLSVPIELECRKWDQSFLFSYLTHDHSVAQAAVILPLDFHSPNFLDGFKGSNNHKPKRDKKTTPIINEIYTESIICPPEQNCAPLSPTEGYPAILTLHGSGIPAQNHADSYKLMPAKSKDYIFGVAGYYVVAPARFGAHNWEGIGDLTARSSLLALRKILAQFPDLFPDVWLHSGIISGHSMGGHGAWITALNSPTQFKCVLPTSGWIKKEEYSNSNSFFSFDVSSSYTDPDLKAILEKVLSEYHVDRFVSNLQGSNVYLRVGSHDSTTHPWFSRRMHRLLQQNDVSTIYEETLGKAHWWWDTLNSNDGGVVNDLLMRNFYASCHQFSVLQHQLLSNFSKFIEDVKQNNSKLDLRFRRFILETSLEEEDFSKRSLITQDKHIANYKKSLFSHQCERNLTLSLINPATHDGLCGIQIIHQKFMMILSQVTAFCNHFIDSKKYHTDKTCELTTSNIERFQLSFAFGDLLFETNELIINGESMDIDLDYLSKQSKSIEICVDPNSKVARVCEKPLQLLSQKSLVNYGPIRHVYDQPLFIVYGTPQDQSLRLSMRDFANYLANSHFASHHSSVNVISDVEYRSGHYMKPDQPIHNIIFIGDNFTNKLLKSAVEIAKERPLDEIEVSKTKVSWVAKFPETVEIFHSFTQKDDIEGEESRNDFYGFKLGNVSYERQDQALLFSMPLVRLQSTNSPGLKNSQEVGMGICITANSAKGFIHLSKLAWPVIPPMVRSPFSLYIPDFVVIDKRIWSEGPGGILAAGFWNSHWKYDISQSYTNNRYL